MKSAVKVLHKKRKWDITESSSDDSDENDSDDSVDDFEKIIINDEIVQNAVKKLPQKNVTITKKDKVAILNLLDVTKITVENKLNKKNDTIAITTVIHEACNHFGMRSAKIPNVLLTAVIGRCNCSLF